MQTTLMRTTFLGVAVITVASIVLFKAKSMPPPPIPDGNYEVRNSASNLVLDDPYSSQVPGEQMIQWDSNGGLNQKWHFVHRGNGFYTIQNVKSGLFLTSPSGSKEKEPPLQQQKATNDDSQLWQLSASKALFVIKSKASALRVDAASGSKLGSVVVLSSPSKKTDDRKCIWAMNRSS